MTISDFKICKHPAGIHPAPGNRLTLDRDGIKKSMSDKNFYYLPGSE